MLGTRGRARRVAVRPEAAHGALPPLPLSLVLAIADRVPADDKLRLAFVSPALRAVADERLLYRDVRLGMGSGVGRASDGLLRAVAAKARGTMRTLDVSGVVGGSRPVVSVDVVAAVCAANADTLQAVDARCKVELNGWPVSNYLEYNDVARLLASAPRLIRLDTDLLSFAGPAQALLRNPALRVQCLFVGGFYGVESAVALVAVLTAHPSLKQLGLHEAPLDAAVALEAVVGLSVGRRLSAISFVGCFLGIDSMPALTRLLEQDTGLASLAIQNAHVGLHISPAFCAALRACALTRLILLGCRLFHDPSGLALLAAATAHPVLQQIDVSWNGVAEDARPAVGAALGALVGANAPALTSLDVSHCDFRDESLRPLVDALPGNTALRSLYIRENNVTPPFAASLLAAVRANTSLRALAANNGDTGVHGGIHGPLPELAEAEALVAARA